METINQGKEEKKLKTYLTIVEYSSSSSNDYLIVKQSTLDTKFIKVIKKP